MAAAALSVQSVLITGASRGIGLEFVKQFISLAQPPQHIFATCRTPDSAKDLQALAAKHPGQVHIHALDVVDYPSHPVVVKWVESIVKDNGLTLLINNAGVFCNQNSLTEVTRDSLLSEVETNAVAPLLLTKAFLPLLKLAASKSSVDGLSVSKAAVLNITSSMGSIGENGSGGRYAYRTSKAALNMITKSLSIDLKPDGILAAVLHPGWVHTDMGGANALIDTPTSVQGMLRVAARLTTNEAGSYLNYKGDTVHW